MRLNVSYQVLRALHTSRIAMERLRPMAAPLRIRKATKTLNVEKSFVDWMRVRVKAGDGGCGGLTLSSVYGNEFNGPDGGDGGNGGHVLFRASNEVNSLAHLKPRVAVQNGRNGSSRNMEGKNAPHKVIDVPAGTLFRNLERQVVAELVEPGSMFLAARGGAGGKGNKFFSNSVNKTPRVAERGGIGETFTFDIELRSMAQVGLIGFPNAGKSTLLRAVSRARPKVAAYPFTTLNPHIGMVPYEDNVQLAVADIPGIIPDAHKNKGLGISFLRHVERCLCLLYVIDMGQPDPQEQFECLKYELEQYSPGLSKRPHGIIANKMDLERATRNADDFDKMYGGSGTTIVRVAGRHGTNIDQLLAFIRCMYDENEKTPEKSNSAL